MRLRGGKHIAATSTSAGLEATQGRRCCYLVVVLVVMGGSRRPPGGPHDGIGASLVRLLDSTPHPPTFAVPPCWKVGSAVSLRVSWSPRASCLMLGVSRSGNITYSPTLTNGTTSLLYESLADGNTSPPPRLPSGFPAGNHVMRPAGSGLMSKHCGARGSR